MRPVAKRTTFAEFEPQPRQAFRPPHLVAVVAFDGVVLGDLATPCEVFRAVRDSRGRSPYEVRVCSLRREVRSEYLTIKVPWRLSTLERANTVIVPGIDSIDRPVPDALLRVLLDAAARRVRVASICSGAFVLARTGVLNGLKATTHWMVARELACRYPEIDVNPDVLYVDNGRLLTSAGAAAGFDLCLYLVRRDCGAEIAAHAARAAVMPLERAGGQAQFIVHSAPLITDNAGIGPLLIWIEQNLRSELSLPALARRAAMSTRTLSRRFREQVGATPAEWVGLARVRRAQRLLETTNLSVEEVATETGFRSASVLREHFGEVVGTAPLAYRRAFAAVGATR
jgi:transcriptional regulator GlxA family with amidase domain